MSFLIPCLLVTGSALYYVFSKLKTYKHTSTISMLESVVWLRYLQPSCEENIKKYINSIVSKNGKLEINSGLNEGTTINIELNVDEQG